VYIVGAEATGTVLEILVLTGASVYIGLYVFMYDKIQDGGLAEVCPARDMAIFSEQCTVFESLFPVGLYL